MRSIISIALGLILFPLLGCSQEKPIYIRSGYYESAIPSFIAVDQRQNLVTGFIEINSEGSQRRVGCQLFYSGKLNGKNEIPIIFRQYSVDSNRGFDGLLTVKADGTVVLKSDGMITPCGYLIDLVGGELLEFNEERSFVRIGVLKVPQQNLYKLPNPASILSSYLIRNDAVGIIKEENEWIFISYLKNEKVRAWIPKKSIW